MVNSVFITYKSDYTNLINFLFKNLPILFRGRCTWGWNFKMGFFFLFGGGGGPSLGPSFYDSWNPSVSYHEYEWMVMKAPN